MNLGFLIQFGSNLIYLGIFKLKCQFCLLVTKGNHCLNDVNLEAVLDSAWSSL